MKAIKVLGGVVVLLIVIIAGAAFYLLNNINPIVKDIIERVGPTVTKTAVNVDTVDIKPREGSGALKGFSVANPEGFTSKDILNWSDIGVQLDLRSLTTDVYVIKELIIDGVNINVEQKGLTTNVQQLLKNLQSDSATSEKTTTESGKEVRLVVKHLVFANNKANIITENYGSKEINIPGFELTNLGDPAVGLTPAELGVAITKPLIQKAKKAGEDKLKDMAKDKLKEKVDAKKEELKAKADELKDKAKAKEDELKEKGDAKKDELKEKLEKEKSSLFNKLKGQE